MTRKDFLQTVAGAAATAAFSSANAAAVPTGKPRRGVSLYSYTADFGVTMTLEDCLAEMNDLGAYGLEILSDTHIEGYPEPSDAWLKNWFAMLDKYKIKPAEYGHWIDSRLYKDRELTVKESVAGLVRDIKLANKLGFSVMRTKMGVIDRDLDPVTNWREIIQEALPTAEQYKVTMCPEIHLPTKLKSKMVEDYVAFIDKTKTKNFGINVDFGVFQNKPRTDTRGKARAFEPGSLPSDMIPLLPYTYCCHAKFYEMDETLTETSIPYDQVLSMLVEHGWGGYMVSEYEGPRTIYAASEQLRRQHTMMKRLLKET